MIAPGKVAAHARRRRPWPTTTPWHGCSGLVWSEAGIGALVWAIVLFPARGFADRGVQFPNHQAEGIGSGGAKSNRNGLREDSERALQLRVGTPVAAVALVVSVVVPQVPSHAATSSPEAHPARKAVLTGATRPPE